MPPLVVSGPSTPRCCFDHFAFLLLNAALLAGAPHVRGKKCPRELWPKTEVIMVPRNILGACRQVVDAYLQS